MTSAAATATVTGPAPVTMTFPFARAGDTGFLAWIHYHTVDGTAVAGTDYVGANGTFQMPAGAATAGLPVTILGKSTNPPDKQFGLALDSVVGTGPLPDFATHADFAAGSDPRSVATADVNGDGKPDLIVATGTNAIVVRLNTTVPGATAPSFGSPQALTSGLDAVSVTTADVNGDGKPDLVVVNAVTPGRVGVLLNTTTPGATSPSFAGIVYFGTGRAPASVTAVDVNGDGRPDLITANEVGGNVSVLLNTTPVGPASGAGAVTPTFAAAQNFTAGSYPVSVAAADVNGDGKPDLIVANLLGKNVSVLLNSTDIATGALSFAAAVNFGAGNLPGSVAAADVNGDGRPDLIVANEGSDNVSVLLNTTNIATGALGFAPQQTFGAGNQPTSVAAADVNGDGKPDLLVSNRQSNNASVFMNTTAPGSATTDFAPVENFGAGLSPRSVAAADLNGDGKPDLLVANAASNNVSVLMNTTPAPTAAAPSFAPQQTFGTGGPTSVASADVNGDGKPDLIVANQNDSSVLVLLNATAPGAATLSFSGAVAFAVGSSPQSVTTADVNGDGKPDLITANYNDGNVSVLLNTTAPGATTPNFAGAVNFGVGIDLTSVAAADVNGDGKPDLIVTSYDGGFASVLLNTTAPGATTPNFASAVNFGASFNLTSVAAADVNGDGKPDLIVADDYDNFVSVRLNTTAPGATTPNFAGAVDFPTGTSTESVAVADVNGDGRPDLITANFNADVTVLLNTTAPGAATPNFATAAHFGAGGEPISVAAADVNGDGRPDLLVANFGGYHGNSVSVLLNTTPPGATTPHFAGAVNFGVGDAPDSVAAADVNGDGHLDLIVANLGNNNAAVLVNTQYAATLAPASVTGTIHYAVLVPVVTLAPTPLTFGDQVVAVTSGAKTETLTNSGTADLEISGIAITGTDAADFTQSNNCPVPGGTLAPSTSCTFQVTFTPSAAGARAATLQVESNASTSPDGAILKGTGIAQAPGINPSPGALDFGDVAVGTTSATLSVTVTNSGNVDISVTGANIGGADAGDFALADNGCTGTLAPNDSCTLKFSFTPTTGGARGATATIATDKTGTSATVALSGTGTAPTVSLSPASVDFGNQKVGTTSATRTVTLTNNGNATLENITLAASSDYTIASTSCGATLAVGTNCTIAVTFTPSAPGADDGTLTVTSNAPSSPDTVALTGTGTAPAVSLNPTSLDFGSLTIGTTSAVETITVKNTGNAVLDFNGAASIGGTHAGDFAIASNGCGATLAVNASCTIGVSFTPTAIGARAASLAIPSDAPAPSPQAAALAGTGTDNPPVAKNGSNSTGTNVAVNGTLVATDSDPGQTLTYSIVGEPAKGGVTITDANTGAYTYTPDANFAGTDSFTFKANDGYQDSNTATVTITVTDNPPTASDGANSTTTNVAVNGQLVAQANNPNQTLTYAVVTQPANGTVTVNAASGAYSYTPGANFAGTDSFSFKANDGNEDSNAATVTITVTDNPPTASDGANSTTTNVAVNGQLVATANNPNQTLTYAVATQPANGTITVNATSGAYTYTPGANFAGTDSFTFKANDGNEDSNTATVTITVTDNPPTASDGTNSTTTNVAINGQLVAQANNPNQTLTYRIVGGTSHGVVTVIGATGAYTYTPATGFAGTDSFSFKANDGNEDSNLATITITVADLPPIARDGSAETTTNLPVDGQLTATNPDGAGQTLAFQIVAAPASGSVTVNAGTGKFTYTPSSNFAGTDHFTFRVFDGYLYSNTTTVTVGVTDIPPVASDGSVATTVNKPVGGRLQATAKNPGQTLSYHVVAAPASGTVSVNAKTGAFTYTPTHNFAGTDRFTFKVNDGNEDSNIATETITVTNTPPVAENGSATLDANTSYSGRLKASDADPGQTLTYHAVAQPAHGELTVNTATGAYSYTPKHNYVGADSFTFKANDGISDSNVATVTITVNQGALAVRGGPGGSGGFGLFGLLALLFLAAFMLWRHRGPYDGNPMTSPFLDSRPFSPSFRGSRRENPESCSGRHSASIRQDYSRLVSLALRAMRYAHVVSGLRPSAPDRLTTREWSDVRNDGGETRETSTMTRTGLRFALVAAAFATALALTLAGGGNALAAGNTGNAWYVGAEANVIKADSDRNVATHGFKGWGLYAGKELGRFSLEFNAAYHSDYPKRLSAVANWVTWGVNGLWFFAGRHNPAFSPFALGGIGLMREYRGDNSEFWSVYDALGIGFTSQPWSAPVRLRVALQFQATFAGNYGDFVAVIGIEIPFGG